MLSAIDEVDMDSFLERMLWASRSAGMNAGWARVG
jgi:hypothetical protein